MHTDKGLKGGWLVHSPGSDGQDSRTDSRQVSKKRIGSRILRLDLVEYELLTICEIRLKPISINEPSVV